MQATRGECDCCGSLGVRTFDRKSGWNSADWERLNWKKETFMVCSLCSGTFASNAFVLGSSGNYSHELTLMLRSVCYIGNTICAAVQASTPGSGETR